MRHRESNCYSPITRAPYTCRKCRTHGRSVPVKRHKRICPYKDCGCYKCQLVEKGRFVVAKQIAIYRDQTASSQGDKSGPGSGSSSTSLSAASSILNSATVSVGLSSPINVPSTSGNGPETFPPTNIKTEAGTGSDSGTSGTGGGSHSNDGPHCRRCRNHNLTVVWKGHKKVCPFQECTCNPCRLIDERKNTEKALREVVDEGPRQTEGGLFEIPHPKLSSPMKLSPCPSFAMTCESMGWRPDVPVSSTPTIPHLEHVMKSSTSANGLYLGSCRPISSAASYTAVGPLTSEIASLTPFHPPGPSHPSYPPQPQPRYNWNGVYHDCHSYSNCASYPYLSALPTGMASPKMEPAAAAMNAATNIQCGNFANYY